MYDFREIEYLKEFYHWMRENIKYGFEDINGQIHDNNLKGIREVFVTRSADDAKRTGFGTCIEKTKILNEELIKLGYETHLYCSFNGPIDSLVTDHDARMHSFVLGVKDDICVFVEPNSSNRSGIHVFESLEQALTWIKSTYNGNQYFIVHNTGYIPEGLNFDQLVSYVDQSEIVQIKDADYKKNSK